jgi:GT2 family glycosyltransferase
MTARVAAVIGNYNGAEHLPDCFDSLAAQTLRPAETILVDACSSDDSAAIARDRGAHLLESENRGLGFLYNRGADATDAEFVLFANNDLAFEPELVSRLVEALAEDETRFAADPTQLDWSGKRVIHACTVLRRAGLLRTPIPGVEIDPLVPAETTAPTLCANAGAMLVRRSMFGELGGFDETFFLDYEDLDLCWRAWARGWSSVYVPAARLRHKVGMSASPTVSPRRLRHSHHNIMRFALKCLPPSAAARVLAGELIRMSRRPGVVAPALASVAGEVPDILRSRLALDARRRVFGRSLSGH